MTDPLMAKASPPKQHGYWYVPYVLCNRGGLVQYLHVLVRTYIPTPSQRFFQSCMLNARRAVSMLNAGKARLLCATFHLFFDDLSIGPLKIDGTEIDRLA